MGKMKNKAVLFVLAASVFLCTAKAYSVEEGLVHKILRKFYKPQKKASVPQPKKSPEVSGEKKSDIKQIEGKNQEGLAQMAKEQGLTDLGEAAKEMTKESIIQDIKNEIEAEEEIMDNIPALKRSLDSEGKESYTYRVDDKDMKLEDLDKDTLSDIITKVYNQATTLRVEAIREQSEAMRRVQNVSRPPSPAPRPPSPAPRPPSSSK